MVNFGIGQYPETCSLVLKEEGLSDNIMTTVEPGTFGGTPLGGGDFGAAISHNQLLMSRTCLTFMTAAGLI
ncbi:hypothetical protein SDC49_20470 [Lactobacillus sp. R2/2]|nr:hypothetical protein [Lactobacillus sp. R2/2]